MSDDRNILRDKFARLNAHQPAAGTRATARAYAPPPPALDLSEEQLRVAFAENLFDLFRAMGALPNAVVEESDSGGRHLAFPANPMFKGVWRSRLSADQADAAIDGTVSWLSSQDASLAFWWVDSDATPVDLGDRLQAQGWVPWELQAPGMAARLEELDFAALGRVGGDYRQTRVRDEAALDDFRRAFVAGFEVPDWAAAAWVEATLAFGIDQAPWRCYVGYLDGEPVASNMLFNGAGVASVFGVAVTPGARGRGIGAAVTLAAYEEAQALGYRYGVLFATELGAPVYRRIGFRDVEATMSRYLWQGSEDQLVDA